MHTYIYQFSTHIWFQFIIWFQLGISYFLRTFPLILPLCANEGTCTLHLVWWKNNRKKKGEKNGWKVTFLLFGMEKRKKNDEITCFFFHPKRKTEWSTKIEDTVRFCKMEHENQDVEHAFFCNATKMKSFCCFCKLLYDDIYVIL